MNLKSSFLYTLLLCHLIPQSLYADCTGPSVEPKDGLCMCTATKKVFNPESFIDHYEKNICEYATHIKKYCQDPEGSVEFVYPSKCYCKKTKKSLSGYVKTGYNGLRFYTIFNEEYDPEYFLKL